MDNTATDRFLKFVTNDLVPLVPLDSTQEARNRLESFHSLNELGRTTVLLSAMTKLVNESASIDEIIERYLQKWKIDSTSVSPEVRTKLGNWIKYFLLLLK